MLQMLKSLFTARQDDRTEEIISSGAYLVDVRTPSEFRSGSVPSAVNIPLDQIQNHLSSLRNKKAIVVFCRSGNRSAMAKRILEQNGITRVYNGGSWQNVMKLINKQ